MLSSSCGSSYASDVDVDIDECERLFPELEGLVHLEGEHASSLDENDLGIIKEAQLLGENLTGNIVKVSLSSVVPKDVTSLTYNPSICVDRSQHNYASFPSENRCTNKVPKYVEFEPENGFAVCGPMSKNAILARENRRKKKEYVTNLENDIETLKVQKQKVEEELIQANSTVDTLKEEIDYLKGVIANETVLGALLKNVPNALNVPAKRPSTDDPQGYCKRHKLDHDYVTSSTDKHPGVCLHVSDGSVSLEFCKKCNSNSVTLHGK